MNWGLKLLNNKAYKIAAKNPIKIKSAILDIPTADNEIVQVKATIDDDNFTICNLSKNSEDAPCQVLLDLMFYGIDYVILFKAGGKGTVDLVGCELDEVDDFDLDEEEEEENEELDDLSSSKDKKSNKLLTPTTLNTNAPTPISLNTNDKEIPQDTSKPPPKNFQDLLNIAFTEHIQYNDHTDSEKKGAKCVREGGVSCEELAIGSGAKAKSGNMPAVSEITIQGASRDEKTQEEERKKEIHDQMRIMRGNMHKRRQAIYDLHLNTLKGLSRIFKIFSEEDFEDCTQEDRAKLVLRICELVAEKFLQDLQGNSSPVCDTSSKSSEFQEGSSLPPSSQYNIHGGPKKTVRFKLD